MLALAWCTGPCNHAHLCCTSIITAAALLSHRLLLVQIRTTLHKYSSAIRLFLNIVVHVCLLSCKVLYRQVLDNHSLGPASVPSKAGLAAEKDGSAPSDDAIMLKKVTKFDRQHKQLPPLQVDHVPNQASTAMPAPKQPVPATELNKHATPAKSALPVPVSLAATPPSASPAMIPFGQTHKKPPIQTTTSHCMSLKAMTMPALTPPAPKSGDRTQLLGQKTSTTSASTNNTLNKLPGQHTSVKHTPVHGLISLKQSMGMTTSLGGIINAGTGATPPGPVPCKLTSMPQTQTTARCASMTGLTGLRKQPVKTSIGGPNAPSATSPPCGVTPLQKIVTSRVSGLSSGIANLPITSAAVRPIGPSNTTATSVPFCLPPSSVQNLTKANTPVLLMPTPVQTPPDHVAAAAGMAEQIGAKHALQQQPPQEKVTAVQAPLGSSSKDAAATEGNAAQDTGVREEHDSNMPTKPWTSTSLAGGLMGNMKKLEAVCTDTLSTWCCNVASILHVCPPVIVV